MGDSAWVTGQGDDVEIDRASQREEVDEPFYAGLDCDRRARSNRTSG